MNAPALGSKITVLEAGKVYRGEVTQHHGGGLFTWAAGRVLRNGQPYGPVWGPDDDYRSGSSNTFNEDATWTRGWHADDSATVNAMRAAAALHDGASLDDPNAAWRAAGSLIGKGLVYLLKRARTKRK
jgi:hypothetical protein